MKGIEIHGWTSSCKSQTKGMRKVPEFYFSNSVTTDKLLVAVNDVQNKEY
jgi:hypothetical protein